MKKIIFSIALIIFLFSASVIHAAEYTYTTILPDGCQESSASGINNSSQIVG